MKLSILDQSPVSAGSDAGQMYALDASTGAILWSFASGGTVIDGPSIANGVIYWGSGYDRFGLGKANNKVYAFAIAGSKEANKNSDDYDRAPEDERGQH